MVVYLLEDHELPLVSLSATMRTGGWLEPQDKIGLAGLTGSVMRTGGGGGLTAAQIDEELEQFAIDINISMGRQSGSASLDVLSKDLARGMRIFAGLLRQPAFEPARVERQVAVALAYARGGQHDLAVLTLRRAAADRPESNDLFTAIGRIWLEVAEAQRDRVAVNKALEAPSKT